MELEIAIESEEGGARASGVCDRIELCRDLALHGLTPSIELVARVRARVSVPLVVLIRTSTALAPSEAEVSRMEEEIEGAIGAGADALALGALDAESGVATRACARLVRACAGRAAVFHRAFDMTRDRAEAVERLVGLGFARVLSAGVDSLDHWARPLDERLAAISETIECARGRIGVVACGGIRSHNIGAFLRLGCDVHSACRTAGYDGTPVWDPEEAQRLHEALAWRREAGPGSPRGET
jgi:copper homeostasis protein